eukprot:TRINITY_DN1888_c0_g1_i12.p1 TRINITY_DN1888_c0_g1~~TRINITY_DN1888_c0_g1_i12.p1  ORF type:complete len:428 (-),score=66.70 TRINITY_DN1888_c0_g1_i12:1737-3020(-)
MIATALYDLTNIQSKPDEYIHDLCRNNKISTSFRRNQLIEKLKEKQFKYDFDKNLYMDELREKVASLDSKTMISPITFFYTSMLLIENNGSMGTQMVIFLNTLLVDILKFTLLSSFETEKSVRRRSSRILICDTYLESLSNTFQGTLLSDILSVIHQNFYKLETLSSENMWDILQIDGDYLHAIVESMDISIGDEKCLVAIASTLEYLTSQILHAAGRCFEGDSAPIYHTEYIIEGTKMDTELLDFLSNFSIFSDYKEDNINTMSLEEYKEEFLKIIPEDAEDPYDDIDGITDVKFPTSLRAFYDICNGSHEMKIASLLEMGQIYNDLAYKIEDTIIQAIFTVGWLIIYNEEDSVNCVDLVNNRVYGIIFNANMDIDHILLLGNDLLEYANLALRGERSSTLLDELDPLAVEAFYYYSSTDISKLLK